ncbi:MAG TPA: glycosyltransferase family 4 protein [Thermoanaerobaculia bacterium]|nr:glycosyltransferase family 4 protein [Thermoanaerobaculia bacterium]
MTTAPPATRTIVHVAQIEISRESGMGRVAWHWQRAFAARGYDFVHIGPAAVGRPVHPALFPFAAYRRYARLGLRPAAILVHEPAGLPFVLARRPAIVFSHGLERRAWETVLAWSSRPELRVRRRSRLLFPWWRLAPADYALAHARALLVLNADDLAYARRRYRRREEDVLRFRNGVEAWDGPRGPERPVASGPATVLFVGSWLPRKGTATLVAAARLLDARGLRPSFVLAGTGLDAAQVLAPWPAGLRPAVRVVPRFPAGEEAALYAGADVLVLPSFYEGQPLALLQAMAAGCCCIASDVAGNRDLVDHGVTGLLHPAGDAERLADCLAECLAQPLLRRRLGESARRAMAGRSWEAVTGEVADFVERIIARGRAAP